MNRLQKKCVIATAGIHLLLLLVLVFGSAFFSPRPKPDDTQLLDVIPSNLIDAAFNSGVRNATPPAPAPVVTPPPQPAPPTPAAPPAPQPPQPKAVETPPTIPERLEKMFTPEPSPEPVKPAPKKTESPKTHQIQISTQLVARVAPKTSATTATDDSQQTARAISTAIRNLKRNFSPGTTIDMPGDSTVAYANYASVVKSIYDRAWTLPDTIAADENITVKVTIASDGTVISSRIIERSGDTPVDASVQRALDRVTFVAAFPEGSSDKQRTYTINFNPQIKKSE
jgi:colicin import membrane protein